MQGFVSDRRRFLTGAVSSLGVAVPALAFALPEKSKAENPAEEISPPEDLMREHGVLNRILLIYEEELRRLDGKGDFDPDVLAQAAGHVRSFVEDYHEKLEQDYLFPRFRSAGKLVDLVDTLYAQHQAGRRLTEEIRQLAVATTAKDATRRRHLSVAMNAFIRMYRPHEAREDTVLFPAFRSLVSPHEFGALGDQFEKKEDELFGEEGFFKVVDQVAELEKRLGIFDLAQFTPK